MKQVSKTHEKMMAVLETIARKHLSLETLATRNGDGLDFSDQAVWSLEAALRAAYDAGMAARSGRAQQVTGSLAVN